MKKVLLVALNAKYTHTCLAIRYVRESCRREGVCEPELLELTINNYLPEILGRIYEAKPDIIGFACYIWNIQLMKALLPQVRRVLPEAVLICGGPEVSYGTEEFLRQVPAVDYVIRGEGEKAMANLLRCLLAGDADFCGITGVAGVRSGRLIDNGVAEIADAAELPFAYRDCEMQALGERILYYETSRGCPFSCAYCLSCASRGVRYRPLELVRRELEFFVRHNVRQVKFVDRTFNADKKHFMPILQFIRDLPSECRTNFHFEVAADYLADEAIALLQAMPRHRVQLEIGIQSVNPQVLRQVQRANNWERLAGNIGRLVEKRNMHIHTDLIIGLPGEDMASFANSFNAVYALDTDMLQLGFLKFLKGSAMMGLVEAYGYQYMDIGPYEVLSNDSLTYGEIHWLHIFEAVFELYHNAGRCRRVCNYCIDCCENGDAFGFYRRLADFWQERQYHHQGHSVRALYEIMGCFLRTAYGGQTGGVMPDELIDSLLRFDVLLAEKGQLRPQGLAWNSEAFKGQIADFWQNKAPVNATNSIKGFRFTSWRDIRHNYHIEAFDYPVHEWMAGKRLPQAGKPVFILFDFTKDEAGYQLLQI